MAPTPTGHGYWLLRVPTAACSRSATRSSTDPPARCGSTRRSSAWRPRRAARLLARRAPTAASSRFGDAAVLRLHRRPAPRTPRSSAWPRPPTGTRLLARRTTTAAIFTFGDAPFQGSGAGHVSPLDQVVQIAGLDHGSATGCSSSRCRSTRPCSRQVRRARGRLAAAAPARTRLLDRRCDGGYGLTTQQAVYAFQKVEDLPRSGISTSRRASGSRPRAGRGRARPRATWSRSTRPTRSS